jgi:putative heme iron utilization protein
MADEVPVPEPPSWAARKLLRAARQASLATTAAGQPFASLVTLAVASDGAVLLLLSDLSEHTRHLRADPRASILVTGPENGPNPQTRPRLTVTATAAVSNADADRARFLAVHPYAAMYAGFGDFNLWRLSIGGGLFVGGFAAAHRLRAAELIPDDPTALHAAEASILSHCNNDHADALASIAAAAGGSPGAWRMATCDADGFDLGLEDRTLRIAFSAPVTSSQAVRAELVRLARASRSTVGLDPPAVTA